MIYINTITDYNIWILFKPGG